MQKNVKSCSACLPQAQSQLFAVHTKEQRALCRCEVNYCRMLTICYKVYLMVFFAVFISSKYFLNVLDVCVSNVCFEKRNVPFHRWPSKKTMHMRLKVCSLNYKNSKRSSFLLHMNHNCSQHNRKKKIFKKNRNVKRKTTRFIPSLLGTISAREKNWKLQNSPGSLPGKQYFSSRVNYRSMCVRAARIHITKPILMFKMSFDFPTFKFS